MISFDKKQNIFMISFLNNKIPLSPLYVISPSDRNDKNPASVSFRRRKNHIIIIKSVIQKLKI